MKLIITIFLFVSIMNLNGQVQEPVDIEYWHSCDCDSMPGLDSTCIDENGFKQGYWKYYRNRTIITPKFRTAS